GPLLILSLLISVILLFAGKFRKPGLLMLPALLVMLGDLVFTLSTNHPLNQLIQSWDLNALPQNVQEVKSKVVNAFQIRLIFMIAVFVLALLSSWIYFNNRINNSKR
ncbi:MAG: hypothetical protein H7Y31_17265, partial [Chitinophagaceae bacterium]|nr:hypothetical protein [Chitinophagaceae bacterium]